MLNFDRINTTVCGTVTVHELTSQLLL